MKTLETLNKLAIKVKENLAKNDADFQTVLTGTCAQSYNALADKDIELTEVCAPVVYLRDELPSKAWARCVEWFKRYSIFKFNTDGTLAINQSKVAEFKKAGIESPRDYEDFLNSVPDFTTYKKETKPKTGKAPKKALHKRLEQIFKSLKSNKTKMYCDDWDEVKDELNAINALIESWESSGKFAKKAK